MRNKNYKNSSGTSVKIIETAKKGSFERTARIIEIVVGAIVGVALITVGLLQYTVYTQQAHIMKVQTGAFLNVEKIMGGFNVDPTTKVSFYQTWIVMKNSGTSMAKVNFGWMNFYDPIGLMSADYQFPNLPGINGGKYVVGPQVEISSGPHTMSTSETDEIFPQKKRSFYAYGTLLYEDNFSKERVTMYCFVLMGANLQVYNGQSVPGVWSFSPCDRHNCVDDDCKSEPRESRLPPPLPN